MNTSAEAKFRSLSKRAAECQRQIGRLSNVDSLRIREETAAQIRSDLRQLDQDIKVYHATQALYDNSSISLNVAASCFHLVHTPAY